MIQVTCAIICNKNKILVTQRGEDSDHPFMWEFPGGKIKTGETSSECIRREIKEELELEIDIQKELVAVNFDYGFKKIKLIPFLCTIKSDAIILNDHIQYKWISWDELREIDFLEADKKLFQQKKNKEILEEYFREEVNKYR